MVTAEKRGVKEENLQEKLRKNIGLLNELTNSGVSYFNLNYYMSSEQGHCLDRHISSFGLVAYVAQGGTRLNRRRVVIPKAVFYEGDELLNIRTFGRGQMSTDNAVYAVRQICVGKELAGLKFQDNLEIKFDKVMSLELPYRYSLVTGKLLISRELIRFLKKKKGF